MVDSTTIRLNELTNEVENLNARLLAVTPNNMIFSALGTILLYGCKATESANSPENMQILLQGQAAGDDSFLNPDVSPNPSRVWQFPNISSIKGGAFVSNDTAATVETAPAAGTSRYDIAYIFAGKEGAGFAVQTGTPSPAVKADFIANGLYTGALDSASPNFDPVLPVGALGVARIYVAEGVTTIPDAVIADLRSFSRFGQLDINIQFSSPPPLGDVTPNEVNAAILNVFGQSNVVNILAGADAYYNFGAVVGASGYGIRDNSGNIEFSDSGNGWLPLHYGAETGLTDSQDLAIATSGAVVGTFDVPPGRGIVVDNFTDRQNPVIKIVVWGQFTNVPVTNIATTPRTYVAMQPSPNSPETDVYNATIIQQATPWTIEQRRDLIILCILEHSDNVNVTETGPFPLTTFDAHLQTIDFIQAIGPINVRGNVFSSASNDLTIKRSAGEQYRRGANVSSVGGAKNPSVVRMAVADPATFRYRFNDGLGGVSEGLDVTDVNPALWDDLSGVLQAVPGGKWTVQREWAFSTEVNILMYGQTLYSSLALAEAAIFGALFNADPDLQENASLRGWLIVKSNATDLSDTASAKFIEADQFGNAPSGGVSSSTTDLQTAYINSVLPQIITDGARGAFTVKGGTGDDDDLVTGVQNNAGSTTYSVNGNGEVVATSVTLNAGAGLSEFISSSTAARFRRDNDGTGGGSIEIYGNSASPADNDTVASTLYKGNSSTGAEILYAAIQGKALDVTNSSPDGGLYFRVMNGGSITTLLTLSGDDLKAVLIDQLEVGGDVTATAGNVNLPNNKSLTFKDFAGIEKQVILVDPSDDVVIGNQDLGDLNFVAGSLADALKIKQNTGYLESTGIKLGGIAAAYLLDYYQQEISFTPVLRNVTVTYTTQTASATRIGDQVSGVIFINTATLDTADSSGFRIGDLPFTLATDAQLMVTMDTNASTLITNKDLILGAAAIATDAFVLTVDGGIYNYNSGTISAGILRLSFSYRTDA